MSGVTSRILFPAKLSESKAKFQSVAATTATGKPTYQQLMMNGMMKGSK